MTTTTTNKLKIVCSFNGKFRRRPPGNKLRYVGGESRIISVDPTNLTFSKLSSLITERVNKYNNKKLEEFTLKYRLPGSESGDSPLVLLVNDDDVLCMVEEFEAYYSKNFDSNELFPIRVWVFVCDNNDGGDEYEHVVDGNEEGFLSVKVKESSTSSDFGCGIRVFGRSLMGSLKGNHGFKRLNNVGKNQNQNYSNHVVGNGRRNNNNKVSSSEHDSLRKLVLKQQLLLARQRDQIRDIGRNYDGSSLGHDQPLIDLRHENSYSIVANEVVCDQDFGLASNFRDKHVINSDTSVGKFGQKLSNDCSLNKQELRIGQKVVSQNLIRQNVLPSCKDQIVGSVTKVESLDRGIGIQNTGLMEERFPKSRLYWHGGGYPGAQAVETIPKQGLATEIECQNTAGLLSGPLENKAYTRQSDMANGEAQTGYSPRAVDKPLIDFGEEHIGEKYVNGCENQANGYDANAIGVYKSQAIANYGSFGSPIGADSANNSGMLVPVGRVVEVMRNCQTSFDSSPNATSICLSSYNPSLSSYKMETLASSHASSKVSEGSQSAQLDLLDSAIEAKPFEETESNRTAVDSANGIKTKWNQTLNLEEGTQDDPAARTTVCDVVIRKSLRYSNMPDGITSDLAVFYTHLATRELQTIKDSDLEYVKELGSGNYGTVFHGKWKGSDVAIKKLKPSCFNGEAKEEDRMVADFWKEAHMLGQLHHPNIVAFYGVVTDGPVTNLATVTEYMVNGSLKQVLLRKDRTIDRRKRIIIAMDAAFGMEYLHEKNIVHFDLKSHNFLVNMRDPQRPVCKIGDLGLSKVKQKTMVSGGIRGTIPWMAPELLNTSANLVSEKVDVYSFGIVMWELLTGEEPYADLRSAEIIAGIIKGTLRPEIPTWCDPAWRSLMERCWSSDPYSRPAFSEIAAELRAMSSAMKIK